MDNDASPERSVMGRSFVDLPFTWSIRNFLFHIMEFVPFFLWSLSGEKNNNLVYILVEEEIVLFLCV